MIINNHIIVITLSIGNIVICVAKNSSLNDTEPPVALHVISPSNN